MKVPKIQKKDHLSTVTSSNNIYKLHPENLLFIFFQVPYIYLHIYDIFDMYFGSYFRNEYLLGDICNIKL